VIEQALYGSLDSGGYRFLAQSPGFGEEWLREAERICTGFGERPAGVSCPECVFALPFLSGKVAVVQVADQGRDDAGRPGALGFRLLVLPVALYQDLSGDPFWIADQYPPPWSVRGDLPVLEWTAGPPASRIVQSLRRVLDVPHSATLLGGVQALLDGGRLVFERSAPDTPLLRSLWALLPGASRCELWPASFTFSNAHRFHAAITPRASEAEYAGYIPEDQAGDYPEGRFEFALQTAVESGNQADLDTLLARRSRSQTMKLALGLLGITIVVAVASAFLNPTPAPRPSTAASLSASPELPAKAECPKLSDAERRELAARLRDLGNAVNVEVQGKPSADALAADIAALDRHLGTPDRARNPGPLPELGPLQRQVRALLWKHHIAEYKDPKLTTPELIDRLHQQVAPKKNAGEGQ
jgi:hypothetical protein